MKARFRLNGHFMSGPTYKVALMLSLAGETFAFRLVDLAAGDQKAPAYLAKARFGQVPCLEDLQNGRSLVQSAAILDYLADRTGRFCGATYDERLAAREWLFWDFDRLATPVFRTRLHAIGFRALPDDVVADLARSVDHALSVLNEHLAARSWLVGENPTIADIDVFGALAFTEEARIDLDRFPKVAAFKGRLAALPGFGRPGDLLPRMNRD